MKPTTHNLYHERMLTVLLYIQKHLDDELSLETLAALTYFSPTHFHRIFKGMMGETVVEHIRRIRLERSAIRLATSKTNVTEAAFGAGYETVESFSRSFKKMFGCPPSKYMEQHWNVIYERMPCLIHYLPENARTGLTLENTKEINMEVRIEQITPMRVAFVRHTGPYIECKPAWETLCGWAGPKGMLQMDSKFIGISHDDPQVTPPDKIRYDACVTVGEDVEGEGKIGIQIIPGGTYAVTTHKGPYEKLEAQYAEFMGQWLPQSGKEMIEMCFELYINDPEQTPPEELLTEIYIAIK